MIYTKKILRREIFPHTFARKFALEVGDFELYDKQNDLVFVRYNELSFLADFLNGLQDHGWIEGVDFSLSVVNNSIRLTLEDGADILYYNSIHDWYFMEKPMPEVFTGQCVYFRDFNFGFYPIRIADVQTVQLTVIQSFNLYRIKNAGLPTVNFSDDHSITFSAP